MICIVYVDSHLTHTAAHNGTMTMPHRYAAGLQQTATRPGCSSPALRYATGTVQLTATQLATGT